MKTNYLTICVLLLALVTFSCSSDNNTAKPVVGEVEIFLIESFETVGTPSKIVESSVVCNEDPLLKYKQILSYNSLTHVFKIEYEAKSLFGIDGLKVHFAPFAVKANNEIIYTGYFWPEYSSQIVNWVVASPILAESDGILKVELGYPASVVDEPIPDNRNDSRIIDIFKRDGKLK